MEASATTLSRRFPNLASALSISAYRVVFLGIGTLLVAAALLKAQQLATTPMPPSKWSSSTAMLLLVHGELLLGMLLLFNVASRWLWWISLSVFMLFAAVSLGQALLGQETCGCFGRAKISPWWTFSIDVVVIGSLLTWRPPMARDRTVIPPLAWDARRGVLAFLVYLAIGIPIGFAMAKYEPQRLTPGLQVLGDSGIVLLEPETWIGEAFPLVSFIESGDQLQTGEWRVLLFHHDCPKCQQILPFYESMARDSNDHDRLPRIALVELPPFGRSDHGLASSCWKSRLSDTHEWFVTTPIEIQLDESVVKAVIADVEGPSKLAQHDIP